jgi:hypothetical protein
MRAGWGEGVRPSRKNEQKGTFQPGMKTPNSTKSRAAQCIPESYVALLMRMCIGIVTVVKLLQLAKAAQPMLVTLLGIVTLVLKQAHWKIVMGRMRLAD